MCEIQRRALLDVNKNDFELNEPSLKNFDAHYNQLNKQLAETQHSYLCLEVFEILIREVYMPDFEHTYAVHDRRILINVVGIFICASFKQNIFLKTLWQSLFHTNFS